MSDIPPRRLFPGETPPSQLDMPPMVGQAEFIQADVTCAQCGYNLRGQARDGRCPECGTGVMEAFRRGMLIYADRAWLMRVRSGVLLVLWGIVASILYMCVLSGVGMWLGASQLGQHSQQFQSSIQIPSVFYGIASNFFSLLVLYRLTAPEPQPGEPSSPVRRGRARLIMILAWITSGVQLIMAAAFFIWGPEDPMAPGKAWIVYSTVLGIVGNVGYFVGFVLVMLHVRAIARRDRTPGLGKLFTFLMWSSAAVFVIFGFSGILMAMTAFNAAHGPFSFPTTMTTTQVGGHTIRITGPTSGPMAVHSTQPTTTSSPVVAQPVLATAILVFLPFFAGAGCFALVIFILGVVAAVKFYRALSWGIDYNVGMAVTPMPLAPPTSGSTPFDDTGR